MFYETVNILTMIVRPPKTPFIRSYYDCINLTREKLNSDAYDAP